MTTAGPLEWTVFWTIVVVVMAIDLGLGRSSSLRTAWIWSGAWIVLSLLFGGWVALRFGGDAGMTYLTAYLLEKSLSLDNLFVFALVFARTGIPPALQPRALLWGIVSTLVMRAILIGAGIYLLTRFHWVIYPFAALLLYAAAQMVLGEKQQRALVEATCSVCTSWIARWIRITPVADTANFLVRKQGRPYATPLLVALVGIEMTDVIFAFDSIPAVLAITRDPFLVYTSNVFALLGLRSLYLVLASVIQRLRFLRLALAVVLVFVAAKMLMGEFVEIAPGVSLAIIAGIVTMSAIVSRVLPARATGHER